MSISSILQNPNNPNEEPDSWANLNVNSVNSNSLISGSLDTLQYVYTPLLNADNAIITGSAQINSDLVVMGDISAGNLTTSDLIASSLIVSDSVSTSLINIDQTHFIGHKRDFDSLGWVSDGVVYIPDYESIYFTRITEIGFINSDSVENATPYRIVCGNMNTLRGNGLESSGLRSSKLPSSDYIVSSNYTLTINDMSFHADPTIDQQAIYLCSSDGTGTADWKSVNFYNFGSTTGENTMLIDNFDNCIFNTLGFLSSSNIKFQNTSGNFGTIALQDSIFVPKTGGESIIFDPTFNCNRRFRIIYSAFVSLGDSAIVIPSDASFPVSGMILDTVNFGGFTDGNPVIDGMNNTSKEALWTNCNGITNTAEIGELNMVNNTSDTIISNTSDYYVVAGSGLPGQFNQRFSVSDTRINYTGAISFPGRALLSGSLSSGNNNQIDIGYSKNGVLEPNSIQTLTTNATGRLEGFSTFYVGLVSQSDYYDVLVRNKTAATNVLVDKLHVLIDKL